MRRKKEQLRTRTKKNAMLQALEKTLGIVSLACEKVNISRQQHYEWSRNDEKYQEKINEITEKVIDLTEGRLYSLIQKENPAAVFFFLKTRAKKRGYIEYPTTEFNVTTNVKPGAIIEEIKKLIMIPLKKKGLENGAVKDK